MRIQFSHKITYTLMCAAYRVRKRTLPSIMSESEIIINKTREKNETHIHIHRGEKNTASRFFKHDAQFSRHYIFFRLKSFVLYVNKLKLRFLFAIRGERKKEKRRRRRKKRKSTRARYYERKK